MRDTIGSLPLFGCSLFYVGALCRFPNAMQPKPSKHPPRDDNGGKHRSSSFDFGATVALIGNAVGYVDPRIAVRFSKRHADESQGICFSDRNIRVKAVYTELHGSHDPQFFLVRGVV